MEGKLKREQQTAVFVNELLKCENKPSECQFAIEISPSVTTPEAAGGATPTSKSSSSRSTARRGPMPPVMPAGLPPRELCPFRDELSTRAHCGGIDGTVPWTMPSRVAQLIEPASRGGGSARSLGPIMKIKLSNFLNIYLNYLPLPLKKLKQHPNILVNYPHMSL